MSAFPIIEAQKSQSVGLLTTFRRTFSCASALDALPRISRRDAGWPLGRSHDVTNDNSSNANNTTNMIMIVTVIAIMTITHIITLILTVTSNNNDDNNDNNYYYYY